MIPFFLEISWSLEALRTQKYFELNMNLFNCKFILPIDYAEGNQDYELTLDLPFIPAEGMIMCLRGVDEPHSVVSVEYHDQDNTPPFANYRFLIDLANPLGRHETWQPNEAQAKMLVDAGWKKSL